MKIEWRFTEAGDPEVEDNSTELWVDGVDTRIAIQHLLVGGGFGVGELEGEGDDLVHIDHGMTKTLASAKNLAASVFLQRKALN